MPPGWTSLMWGTCLKMHVERDFLGYLAVDASGVVVVNIMMMRIVVMMVVVLVLALPMQQN